MQIILRRASSLEKACDQAIAELKKIDWITRLSVNQVPMIDHGAVSAALSAQSSRALETIQQIQELMAAKARIRQAAGKMNDAAGVNDLNREDKALDAEEKWLNGLASELSGKSDERAIARYGMGTTAIHARHDINEVREALKTTQTRIQTTTNGQVLDYVEVPVLPEEQVKPLRDRIRAIRRRRQALQDERAALNLKHFIELPGEVVDILSRHKLLDVD